MVLTKIIALAIGILTIRQLFLQNKKTKLEIQKLKLEINKEKGK
ncbi:hypothetical protein V4S33_06420 [Enterococcus cecorum]|nr:hypothetical protein CIRMBP1277_00743 [Enterococcus cecorum]